MGAMRRAAIITGKCLVAVLVAFAVASALVLGYARSHGLMLLSVQTGSMRPAIHPGDAVLLQQGIYQLTAGDVISYRSIGNDKLIITHRVIAYDAATGQVMAKGDNLAQPDPVFGIDRVVGKVQRTLPLAGYSFSFVRHPIGLAVAVYVPAAVLASGEIRRLNRYYQAQHYRLHLYFR